MREYVSNLPKDVVVGGYWSAATDYVNAVNVQSKADDAENASKGAPAKATA